MKIFTISSAVIALVVASPLTLAPRSSAQLSASEVAGSREALQGQSSTSASSTSAALRIPILIYHSIYPTHPGETKMQLSFNVPPGVFEQQLNYLQTRGYTTISLDQLLIDLEAGTTTQARPVVLTFDDGWHDQYTTAFSLLKKYHETATFYVYTNPIGKDPRFLNWDEIKSMQMAGMTIGSHTISHPYLSKLDADQLHHEVFDSKKILEGHLGIPIVHFASPFGYTNDELVALLREAGYATGRSTQRSNIHTKNDLLHLSGYFAPQNLQDFEWILQEAP